jgi:predicted signal transduction protein with EAL and GGDEF domain
VPVDFEKIKIPVSASFGIAKVTPSTDIDTATKYADEALYEAKEEGRNRVIYSRKAEMSETTLFRYRRDHEGGDSDSDSEAKTK